MSGLGAGVVAAGGVAGAAEDSDGAVDAAVLDRGDVVGGEVRRRYLMWVACVAWTEGAFCCEP